MTQEQKIKRIAILAEIKELFAQNPLLAGKIKEWVVMEMASYAEQYDNALDFPSVRFLQGGRVVLADIYRMVSRRI